MKIISAGAAADDCSTKLIVNGPGFDTISLNVVVESHPKVGFQVRCCCLDIEQRYAFESYEDARFFASTVYLYNNVARLEDRVEVARARTDLDMWHNVHLIQQEVEDTGASIRRHGYHVARVQMS